MALYTGKRVKRLIARLKEEYETALNEQLGAAARLKEENRTLRARLLVLEEERANVADALVLAAKEGDRLSAERARAAENENRELLLLADKCRLLSDRLQEKYPDREDVAEFSAFTAQLLKELGEEEAPSGFNMDDVIAPKYPLDLGKLCKEMGVMEDDL